MKNKIFNMLIALVFGILVVLAKALFLFAFYRLNNLTYSCAITMDGFSFLVFIYSPFVFLSTVVLINQNIFNKITALIFNLVLIILYVLGIHPIKNAIVLLFASIISVLLVFFILNSFFRTSFRKKQENAKLLSIFGITVFVIFNMHNVFDFGDIVFVVAYLFFSLLVSIAAMSIAFKKGVGYSFIFYLVTLLTMFIEIVQ